MDFLAKAFAQVGDLFRSMTPAARITAGLLLAVVVISLAYLLNSSAAGPDDYLLAGQSFSSAELGAMEVAFGKAGLANYEVEGSKVRIPRGQKAAFLAALADGNALPADFGTYLRNTLDKGGVFVSKDERERQTKVATQETLALVIRSMKGIEKASVIYDVKTKPSLNRETEATAIVSVKPVGSLGLDESRIRDIRHVVASGFAGLKPENVTVADLNGRTYPGGGPDGLGAAEDNKYFALKAQYEKQLYDKIRNALSYVPGVVISTYVELDPKLREETRQLQFSKPDSAITFSKETSQDKTSDSLAPGGVPGVRSNNANQPAAVSSQATAKTVDNRSENEQVTKPGGNETSIEKIGLIPQRATALVGVPQSYYEMVWRRKNNITDAEQKPDKNALAAIEADEIQKIQSYVVPLLPVPEKTDPLKQVTVKTFQDVPHPEMPEPSFATTATSWLGQYWSTLGMTMLGLVSLIMLRSMVRSGPAVSMTPAPAGASPLGVASRTTMSAAPSAAETEEAEEEAAIPAARRLKKRPGGPSLRDELADMVKEDPEGAASILRSWIGNPT